MRGVASRVLAARAYGRYRAHMLVINTPRQGESRSALPVASPPGKGGNPPVDPRKKGSAAGLIRVRITRQRKEKKQGREIRAADYPASKKAKRFR